MPRPEYKSVNIKNRSFKILERLVKRQRPLTTLGGFVEFLIQEADKPKGVVRS